MATLHLEIVTPEQSIFSGEVESVLLPGTEGEMGILPFHAPLITQLNAGELHLVQKGKTQVLAIGEGFAEITGTTVSVLTDGAVNESDIDLKLAEEAMQRAQDALRAKTLVGEELEATQATLARSLAQIQVKRRRHSA